MRHYSLLLLALCIACQQQQSATGEAQKSAPISYGNNPDAGHYFNVGDANLYYEIYGKGRPIVLLHGGVFGGIDEFQSFIEKLSPDFQVICIATRGHGKSEIGNVDTPFTWEQRADDAYKVIRSITQDSVMVLGFSDGGYSGYKLAAIHPEVVKKMIIIGSGDRPKGRVAPPYKYTTELLLGKMKEYFEPRLKLMPAPERWEETLSKLNVLYEKENMSKETFEKIQCPMLIMGGDRDGGSSVESLTMVYHSIPGSSLSIIPGCDHVVFDCNFPALWEAIVPFIK